MDSTDQNYTEADPPSMGLPLLRTRLERLEDSLRELVSAADTDTIPPECSAALTAAASALKQAQHSIVYQALRLSRRHR